MKVTFPSIFVYFRTLTEIKISERDDATPPLIGTGKLRTAKRALRTRTREIKHEVLLSMNLFTGCQLPDTIPLQVIHLIKTNRSCEDRSAAPLRQAFLSNLRRVK